VPFFEVLLLTFCKVYIILDNQIKLQQTKNPQIIQQSADVFQLSCSSKRMGQQHFWCFFRNRFFKL